MFMQRSRMNWLKGGLTGIVVSIVIIFLHTLRLSSIYRYALDIAVMGIFVGLLVGVVSSHYLFKSKMKDWKKGGIIGVIVVLIYSVILTYVTVGLFDILMIIALILSIVIWFIVPGFLIGALIWHLLKRL